MIMSMNIKRAHFRWIIHIGNRYSLTIIYGKSKMLIHRKIDWRSTVIINYLVLRTSEKWWISDATRLDGSVYQKITIIPWFTCEITGQPGAHCSSQRSCFRRQRSVRQERTGQQLHGQSPSSQVSQRCVKNGIGK